MTVDDNVEQEGALKRDGCSANEFEGTLALEVFVMEIEKVRRDLFENGYVSETCPAKYDRYEEALVSFLLPKFPGST